MVSIIIVNYKVRKQVIECVYSILKSLKNIPFEIVVVDNEGDNKLKKKLSKLNKTKYIESNSNLGFGGGNNLGAKNSTGKYLLFLNPDTIVNKSAIQELLNFYVNNNNVGIVSPLLINENLKPFPTQSKKELTPLNALFSFSLLRKLFINKSIYSDPFFKKWDYEKPIESETIPGAAFMISRDIFDKINGFDESFFLYFEENDISKRVKQLGYKLFINPKSKIIHKVAQSTAQIKNRDEIFKSSRLKYFKKHYGLSTALMLETVLRINKISLIILLTLFISLFLRTANLSISMPFIGDQGWFYISARDLLVNGDIPLVGITSSHTWLHQGPLWTYILAVALFIGEFNPLSGGVITAIFGTISTYVIYRFGKEMFSQETGIVAALFYSVSPLVIFFERMPFDPSVIPFFTICYFYCIYKWINGKIKYFPLILFFIAVLYNLELATFSLVIPFILLFFFGLVKKERFVYQALNKNIFVKSVLLFLIPMIPVLIYDMSNGFKQTLVFLVWVIYKPFSFLFKTNAINPSTDFLDILNFLFINLQKLIFNVNFEVSAIIFLLSLLVLAYKMKKDSKSLSNPYFLLFIFLIISILGIIINKTPSDAYLPILFPFVILTVSIFFALILRIKFLRKIILSIVFVILITNFIFSYKNTFKPDYKNRLETVDKIIVLTNGQEYNLIGEGNGSQFESFTMNYEYLLWWKGVPPSKKKENLKIYVSENETGIKIR